MRKMGKGRLFRTAALFSGFLGLMAIPVVADANTVTISGSMEGSIKISNGDWVSGGYAFSVQGNHPAMTVHMQNASITFSGSCSNGGTGSLTVPLKPGPYSIPANDNSVFPSGNEASDTSFQGSVQANVCGGNGTLDASNGATFSADLQSDNTVNTLNVQFHYRDPNAKGKGNYDCTASNYAADVCGASWSGTAHLTPSNTSTTSTTSPCGTSGSSTTCSTTTSPCGTSGSSTTCSTTTSPCGTSGSSSTSCSTTSSTTSNTTTSSTAGTSTTTTASLQGIKNHRHKCAKGKVRKHGKCVAKNHRRLSRSPRGKGPGFTG